MKTPHYEIVGFRPPPKGTDRMGSHGFCVRLSSETVNRMYKAKLKPEHYKRFQEMAGAIAIGAGLSRDLYETRVTFVDDTCLLRSWSVTGNCTCMGMDGNTQTTLKDGNLSRDYVDYGPHNVDSYTQSYCLLSIFLLWIEYADTLANL